jgi:hypothetical protein
VRGIDFLRDAKNKREVVALTADWFKIHSDLAQESYDRMIEAYPPGGIVPDEAIEKDLEIARQAGVVKTRVPLSRVVDFRLVKEVRAELSSRQK